MAAPLIEIAILIGAGYLSIFEWIKKKDIKSNEKNDFFVPASFLVVGIILAFTIGVDGEGIFPFASMICGIAAVPLVISLVLTGMAQDQQKLDGDLTYNEGDKFWIIQDKLSPLSSELKQFDGQEGEITEVNADRSVEMKFADDSVGTFWLTNLSNIPPESPKSEKKGWWQ
tara:strand:- start:2326 stop:2838 length:513 start_codon:yes stop_codon:yes gene_type:complete